MLSKIVQRDKWRIEVSGHKCYTPDVDLLPDGMGVGSNWICGVCKAVWRYERNRYGEGFQWSPEKNSCKKWKDKQAKKIAKQYKRDLKSKKIMKALELENSNGNG